jgi:hypothetical protein
MVNKEIKQLAITSEKLICSLTHESKLELLNWINKNSTDQANSRAG